MRRRTRILFSIQGTVLLLALLWGWLRHIPWWQHLHWDAGVALAALTGVGLSLAGQKLTAAQEYERFLQAIFADLPLSTLAGLALASGLAEEALFRGVLVPELGLVFSSLVFGVLHAGDRRLYQAAFWSLLVALGLGRLYLATGNLAHCVALHAASNLTSFVGLKGILSKRP